MQPNPTPSEPADRIAHYRDVLAELVDLGMDLARTVVDNAKRPIAADPEPTLAFACIAQAIRRTILLAQHLEKPLAPAKPIAARKQVIRAVEDEIRAHAKTPAQAERLERELVERVETPELLDSLDEDLATQPLAKVIATICQDLGLRPVAGTPTKNPRPPEALKTLLQKAGKKPSPACGRGLGEGVATKQAFSNHAPQTHPPNPHPP